MIKAGLSCGWATGSQLTALRGRGNPAGSSAFRVEPLPWVPCVWVPGSLCRCHAGQVHSHTGQLLTANLSLSLLYLSFVPCRALTAAPRFLSRLVSRRFSHRFPKDFTRPPLCPGSPAYSCRMKGGGWCPAPPPPVRAMLPHEGQSCPCREDCGERRERERAGGLPADSRRYRFPGGLCSSHQVEVL